jgi:hypothetical protein
VKEVTPNVVLILETAVFQKSIDTEPISSLSTIIENTLSREPISLQSANANIRHQTYLFSASFMEHSTKGKSGRRNPINYVKTKNNRGQTAFGAKLRASFHSLSPSGNGAEIGVRESTASIVFDTLKINGGTLWTMYSIGDFEEAEALEWMSDTRQGIYTSPQEIFLDKLGESCDIRKEMN